MRDKAAPREVDAPKARMSANPGGIVSVVIPARNEEANIERVVDSLANQEGVREILVVDDQSIDGTPKILAALKVRYPLLRVIRLECLPHGWLGKPHAAASGSAAATGDWLLFTDADTFHLAGSLCELVRLAEEENAGLLSVSPGQETPTWWERSVIPLVFTKLATLFRFEDISNPQSPAAAANGQYILVKRELYERVGGHAAVKSAILEDVELARRIKAQGGKLLFLPGARWVRTRMYRNFGDMWEGWTKNLYLLYSGSVWKMLAEVASLWLLDAFPAVGFAAVSFWLALARPSAAIVLLALGFFLLTLARQWTYGRALARLGFEPGIASYQPVGAVLLGVLMLHSLRAHLTVQKIRWKGRRYATRGRG
jgi:chlorobactene glucosyltransferase